MCLFVFVCSVLAASGQSGVLLTTVHYGMQEMLKDGTNYT
jgi:hypothetical protein